MPTETLSNFILLPELKMWNSAHHDGHNYYWCVKEVQTEYCPKCATPSMEVYDTRDIAVKDAPIRGHQVTLYICKKRYWCKTCRRPFTEPIAGIRKGKRHTERYARSVKWACEHFADLKSVRRAYRCSASFLYKIYYKQLEAKLKETLNYAWPTTLGIDEHSFRKSPETRRMEFASMIVDYNNKRVRELVQGKTTAELKAALADIPGRENVKNAVIDMCDPFKNFVREFFPNAELTADKFHVLRLLSPAILKKRREITGTRADAKAKSLLLRSAIDLDYSSRLTLWRYLGRHPELQELYRYKEILHKLYRTRGYNKASRAFTLITDRMATSVLPQIKTLRRTLLKWRAEILNYFKTGLTNARTEGFNNKAKVVKRRAYGYRNFRNYRLKVLTACL